MFIVEKIIEHRKIGRKYDILVKWYGHDNPNTHFLDNPEDITWEPISNYKDNIVFHEYCYSNGLQNLIPAECR